MQYRKKPVVIEAFMYGIEPRPDWFNDKVTSNEIITYVGTDIRDSSEYYCEIKTLEGVMRGNCRDYIIKGVQGEVYPCKPDIFEMTYELASTLPQQEISDESWEGCDGCTEQDEIMYKNGYVKGYNAASSQTTSDKWKEYQDWLNEHPEDNLVEITYTEKDIRLAYMQGYNRGKDGNPKHMEEYITHVKSTKTPDVEISDEEIEKGGENAWSDYEYQEGNLYSTTFRDGWLMAIKWYREQLKLKKD